MKPCSYVNTAMGGSSDIRLLMSIKRGTNGSKKGVAKRTKLEIEQVSEREMTDDNERCITQKLTLSTQHNAHLENRITRHSYLKSNQEIKLFKIHKLWLRLKIKIKCSYHSMLWRRLSQLSRRANQCQRELWIQWRQKRLRIIIMMRAKIRKRKNSLMMPIIQLSNSNNSNHSRMSKRMSNSSNNRLNNSNSNSNSNSNNNILSSRNSNNIYSSSSSS